MEEGLLQAPPLSSEEKIKAYKEQSKFCALCGKPSLFDGCGIQLVSVTETGKVIAPYEAKDRSSSASLMVPMCGYHMILSQEGLIAITTQHQFIQTKLLTALEPQTDEDLKKFLLKIGRAENSEINRAYKHVAKTIISARKFQIEMEKGIEKAKKDIQKKVADKVDEEIVKKLENKND
jgi:hypothetical protein